MAPLTALGLFNNPQMSPNRLKNRSSDILPSTEREISWKSIHNFQSYLALSFSGTYTDELTTNTKNRVCYIILVNWLCSVIKLRSALIAFAAVDNCIPFLRPISGFTDTYINAVFVPVSATFMLSCYRATLCISAVLIAVARCPSVCLSR